ncbi:hypothetical protein HYALB_00008048 [Hymenoscyphus albidus]|uniref:Uncharacterized protein n=1 Tax=Hymenoscyphus albidus TaxID=595503 RepID=A0A9N9LMK0_9HELO|nr:hypothetical protein HYALB_00008048 [Hymenoscyphus albidus]
MELHRKYNLVLSSSSKTLTTYHLILTTEFDTRDRRTHRQSETTEENPEPNLSIGYEVDNLNLGYDV